MRDKEPNRFDMMNREQLISAYLGIFCAYLTKAALLVLAVKLALWLFW